MNPFLAMLLVLAAFAALMLSVSWARRRSCLGAEGARKTVHICMGLGTAAFPWLFRDTWAVLVLTGAFLALLLALRFVVRLRQKFGGVLGGVGRASAGELYFPVAICGLFALTNGAPLDFVIPVLVLTFADAVAALVGTQWGRHRYMADEGEKSWEGSLAFLGTAFVCVFVPLVATGHEPLHSALAALCIATVTMLAEATAWRGLDNLFVPFATLAMLRIYRDEPESALWGRIVALLLLAVLHGVVRRRLQLREGTLFGALVILFVFAYEGSRAWVVAPFTVLLLHPLPRLWHCGGAEAQSHLALLSYALPPLAWLAAWRLWGVDGFAPSLVTCGAQLAMTCASVWRTDLGKVALLVPSAALGWLCILVPRWCSGEVSAYIAGISALAIIGALLVFHIALPLLREPVWRHWFARAVFASLASIVVYFT